MFLFRRKNKKEQQADLGWLKTDLHSHLVPGIDDGAPDTETSLELIRGLQALGFQKIITTPHILWEVYPNSRENILSGAKLLQEQLQVEKSSLTLGAAAEYFIDEHFEQLLRTKQPLLTIKDNLVLVEFSMVTAPMDLKEVLFEMQLQGYQPLIAHPERYIYLKSQKSFFDQLKDSGCQFQLNLLSLAPFYGTSVQDLAAYLIKKDFYDYAGTDLHTVKQLAELQRISASPLYQRLKDSGQIKNHLL
jgi:protein-tyrosine phosphatase